MASGRSAAQIARAVPATIVLAMTTPRLTRAARSTSALRALAASLLVALPAPLAAQPSPAADAPPPIAREFRASWVATVSNIDWPSRPGLSSWEQQAELRAIMDRAVALRMNAVVFQVRPAADALYASRYEPWSEYLTGTQGQAPEPYYDPLALAVQEAHARGLELHAWFNPYRAKHPSSRSAIARTHVSQTHPALVRTYGRHLWMDPGLPEVRRRSLDVIADVVRRYDVDGVHIDDYFYPYPERDSAGRSVEFPDEPSWRKYQAAGGRLARDDWRRDNVNRFVREMYAEVKRIKPQVKVGVSPFGLWRPGTPASIRGFDPYEQIYADSRLWWNNGWVDYFAPQLYWPIAQEGQSFPVLFDWWRSENTKGRHLWVGLYTSRVGSTGAPTWPASEIVDQIGIIRQRGDSLAMGHIHFSEKGLRTARESAAAAMRVIGVAGPRAGEPACVCAAAVPGGGALAPGADSARAAAAMRAVDSLRLLAARRDSMIGSVAGLYTEPALVPASPWLDRTPPAAPTARVVADSSTGAPVLRLRPVRAADVWLWAIQSRDSAGTWTTTVRPGRERDVRLGAPGTPPPARLVVRAVDRTGNLSRVVEVR